MVDQHSTPDEIAAACSEHDRRINDLLDEIAAGDTAVIRINHSDWSPF